jgi:hypothetical protein
MLQGCSVLVMLFGHSWAWGVLAQTVPRLRVSLLA